MKSEIITKYHIDHVMNRPNADMNTNIQNIACLDKIMYICNKQHLSNI